MQETQLPKFKSFVRQSKAGILEARTDPPFDTVHSTISSDPTSTRPIPSFGDLRFDNKSDESLDYSSSKTYGTPISSSVPRKNLDGPQTVDVLIVGAGVTGLLLANILTNCGVSYMIVDALSADLAATQDDQLTYLIHSNTLDCLSYLDLMKHLIDVGHIIRGMEIYAMHQGISALSLQNLTKFADIDTSSPFLLTLCKGLLRGILMDSLQKSSQQIHYNYRLIDLKGRSTKGEVKDQDKLSIFAHGGGLKAGHNSLIMQSLLFPSENVQSDSNQASLQPSVSSPSWKLSREAPSESQLLDKTDPILYHQRCYTAHLLKGTEGVSDSIQKIQCRFVVGCDGVFSSVRHLSSLSLQKSGSLIEIFQADISVNWGHSFSDDRFFFVKSSRGRMIGYPLPDHRWKVVCCRSLEDPSQLSDDLILNESEKVAYEELQHILTTLVPNTVLLKIHAQQSFTMHQNLAPAFSHGNVFLVGRAAHLQYPFFSHDINATLQDVCNLGWKLALATRRTSSDFLETYELERRPVIINEMNRLDQDILTQLLGNEYTMRNLFSTVISTVVARKAYYRELVTQLFFSNGACYAPNILVSPNHLGRQAAIPGTRAPDAAIVIVPLLCNDLSCITETPATLQSCFVGGHHSLLLAIRVLPPGTKARSVLGCELSDEAERWNIACLERLAKLTRILHESLRTLDIELAERSLRVTWVICGLVNYKRYNNTIGLGQIKNHLPHRLKYYFLYGSKCANIPSTVVVDYENEVHTKYGLKLVDPDSLLGHERSGAFVLIRPDGIICCNGYAGDSKAVNAALNYAFI